MRWQVTLSYPGGRRLDHVVVDADPDTPVSDFSAAVGQLARGSLWLGERPFSGESALAASGLRDGSILGVGGPLREATTVGSGAPPAPLPAAGISGWELAVVSGPDAGTSVSLLTAGDLTVGRDPTATLVLEDQSASRRHARFFLQGEGSPVAWTVEDLGSTHGTFLGGDKVNGPVAVPPETPIEIGSSVLELRNTPAADADLHPDADGDLAFNRPARIQPATSTARVEAPAEPAELEATPLPWLQALVPLVVAGVLYLVLRSTTVLLFAVFSPVMFVSGTVGTHRRQRRKRAQELAAYKSGLAAARGSWRRRPPPRRPRSAGAGPIRRGRRRWPLALTGGYGSAGSTTTTSSYCE